VKLAAVEIGSAAAARRQADKMIRYLNDQDRERIQFFPVVMEAPGWWLGRVIMPSISWSVLRVRQLGGEKIHIGWIILMYDGIFLCTNMMMKENPIFTEKKNVNWFFDCCVGGMEVLSYWMDGRPEEYPCF
jgi:hypothetical protein